MGSLLQPFVEESTTTTGTGTLSLDGATAAFRRTFVEAFGTGQPCFYCIFWGPHWEYGLGGVTDGSPDTLTRDLVINSSAAGAKLSLGAGTKTVTCDIPPEMLAANGVQDFADGDTSPSVKGGTVFKCSNTASTTITALDDGIPGQEISILFTNSNTTMQQGSILKHPAGLDITPTANDVLTYVKIAFASAWQLVANSQNG